MAALNTSHRLSEIVLLIKILVFGVLSQFDLLIFVTICFFEFFHSLSFGNFTNFELNFILIQVFEFFYNSSFSVFLFYFIFFFIFFYYYLKLKYS